MTVEQLLVGAVSYHPRVVTIWEAFCRYFRERGLATEYVLFSTYEQLVDAAADGHVDIAWNTNTAYLALDRRLGGRTRILGMRDVDVDFATLFVTRRGEAFGQLAQLAGSRVAIGSRDCAHAAILPLHFMTEAGVADDDVELVRFERDLGKHGDTGGAERLVVEAVAAGRADAGAIGDATLARFRREGLPALDGLEVAWRSPTYYHCNFTATPAVDEATAQHWTRALVQMSYEEPANRQAMELEGVRRWMTGGRSGYWVLEAAMRDQGLLA